MDKKIKYIEMKLKKHLITLLFLCYCILASAQQYVADFYTMYGAKVIYQDFDTLKPWYIPAEYPAYKMYFDTWKDSYLEFAANNKFRLVKRHTSGRNFLFVTGDYLFDYSKKLLYLKFADSVSFESYEMVFDVEYCKEKRKKMKHKTVSGGIHPKDLGINPKKKFWISYIRVYVIKPKLPIRARKNLRHWNGTLNMNRYIGATWDMPIAEILNCEKVNSGVVSVQRDK